MVFGAMTQGNGFESGYNLRNIRWTGDFYSNARATTLTRFTGVDVNLTGSNIYFMSTHSLNNSINVLNILTLSTPYQLSSFTNRLSVVTNAAYRGLSFADEGTLFTTTSGGALGSNAKYTNFAIPLTPAITFTTPTGWGDNNQPYHIAAISSPLLTSSSGWYHNVEATVYPATDNNRTLTYDDTRTGTGVNVPNGIIPSQSRYSYGLAGVAYDRVSRRKLFTLETCNVVQNTMYLTSTYVPNYSNLTSVTTAGFTTLFNQKYQRVNLYPLFPANMKPTSGHGIGIDRVQGKYIFVCCTIGANEYIVKFQMRSI